MSANVGKMSLEDVYTSGSFTLKVYVTKRSGLYGYQFAARLSHAESGNQWTSSRTTGCGYSKDAACVEEVFALFYRYPMPLVPPSYAPYNMPAVRMAQKGQIAQALELLSGHEATKL